MFVRLYVREMRWNVYVQPIPDFKLQVPVISKKDRQKHHLCENTASLVQFQVSKFIVNYCDDECPCRPGRSLTQVTGMEWHVRSHSHCAWRMS
jgi:hypothetical protein